MPLAQRWALLQGNRLGWQSSKLPRGLTLAVPHRHTGTSSRRWKRADFS